MIEKRQLLRNNEYYDIQEIFDNLYSKSKHNYKFKNLFNYIIDDRNIELAYRNIKKNKGSTTSGVDGKNINDLKNITNKEITLYVKRRLENYTPQKVRRVEIPKPNGKLRPLGIPTIGDRIIQQCIKQVLEPICEAKFYKHSYGFRPNRSTEHAVSRSVTLANRKFHHVVDIDIEGFFDNVNHGKLLKQIWTLGIRDKKLISIISKILKSPIEGIGVPKKGTPQGGILSPLLSNIVLNELDWWIANQWESIKTRHKYTKCNKYTALKKTKLKEMFIVRYADDFKIFCKNRNTAKKAFIATNMWLKERLNLQISKDKSKVVNLNKNYSEFLGFKMKVRNKRKKKVVTSHISEKAKEKIKSKLKKQIVKIQKDNNSNNVNRYNAIVLGVHNYYRIATNAHSNFNKIAYILGKSIHNRTKNIRSKIGKKTKAYCKLYGEYKSKATFISGIALFPIGGIKTRPPINFTQEICNYTIKGRNLIHSKLRNMDYKVLKYMLENPISSENIEFNDNRISLYIGQNCKCAVTKKFLEIGEMEVHHIIPKQFDGDDKYDNLIFVTSNVHKLIHATNKDTINKYLDMLKLNPKQLSKINELRVMSRNFEIL